MVWVQYICSVVENPPVRGEMSPILSYDNVAKNRRREQKFGRRTEIEFFDSVSTISITTTPIVDSTLPNQ